MSMVMTIVTTEMIRYKFIFKLFDTVLLFGTCIIFDVCLMFGTCRFVMFGLFKRCLMLFMLFVMFGLMFAI